MITITTDFKDQFATSQLKVVIYSLGFNGQLIENHDVEPFSILEGAYGIWQLAKHCPPGTIHVGIVDPGVGSDRAGIIIKTKDFWFVGPDNGLLWQAASPGLETIWQINESCFDQVSNTFHGRDVFVKVAVLLSKNYLPDDFGCKQVKQIQELDFKQGQILHIDNYGNAKVFGQNTFGLPLVKTFSDVGNGKPLILNGSSDLLELAVNLGNARDKYGLKLGQIIEHL